MYHVCSNAMKHVPGVIWFVDPDGVSAQGISLPAPLDDVNIRQAGRAPREIYPARDPVEVNFFDDLHEGVRGPVAVEVLEEGLVLLDQLFKS